MSGEKAEGVDIAKMIRGIIERWRGTMDNALSEKDMREIDERRGKPPWPKYKKRERDI